MSCANGIGNAQDPFPSDPHAASGAWQTERAASILPADPAVFAAAVHAKLSGFGGALARMLTQSDVRMDKVAALQQAIASGSYKVSASDVADKIIGSMLR